MINLLEKSENFMNWILENGGGDDDVTKLNEVVDNLMDAFKEPTAMKYNDGSTHDDDGSGAEALLVWLNEVIQAWMDAEAYRLYTFQTVTRMREGGSIGADSSLNKLFWSEMDVKTHETALAILEGVAELEGTAPEAIDRGSWLTGFQFALAGPIYAGTNEIQRNIVAERVLGLPRR